MASRFPFEKVILSLIILQEESDVRRILFIFPMIYMCGAPHIQCKLCGDAKNLIWRTTAATKIHQIRYIFNKLISYFRLKTKFTTVVLIAVMYALLLAAFIGISLILKGLQSTISFEGKKWQCGILPKSKLQGKKKDGD